MVKWIIAYLAISIIVVLVVACADNDVRKVLLDADVTETGIYFTVAVILWPFVFILVVVFGSMWLVGKGIKKLLSVRGKNNEKNADN